MKKQIIDIAAVALASLFLGIVIFPAAHVSAAACAYTSCNGANTSFPCDCGDNTAVSVTPYCNAAKSVSSSSQSACYAAGDSGCVYKTYTGICEVSQMEFKSAGAGYYDYDVKFSFTSLGGSVDYQGYAGTKIFAGNVISGSKFNVDAWSASLGVSECGVISVNGMGLTTVIEHGNSCAPKLRSGKWNCSLNIATSGACLSDSGNIGMLSNTTQSQPLTITAKFISLASIYSNCGLGSTVVGNKSMSTLGSTMAKDQYVSYCSAFGGTATCTSTANPVGYKCQGSICPTSFYSCSCDCSGATVTVSATTASTTTTSTAGTTTSTTSGSKSNGSSCSANNECSSGVCSYTYCVPDSSYCGGVKDPMYFANGATAGNQWLDGVCRNGVWKTVLNGTGCNSFACDSGSCSGNKCVAATSGKLTTEQIQAMIVQIKELINSLIAQLARMAS